MQHQYSANVAQCKNKRLCRNELHPKKLDWLLTIRFEKEFGISPGSFLLTGI